MKLARINKETRRVMSDYFDNVGEHFLDAYAAGCRDIAALADRLENYVRDCVDQNADAEASQQAETAALDQLAALDRVQWQEIARRLDREHGIIAGGEK